jgi:hypothetical protein
MGTSLVLKESGQFLNLTPFGSYPSDLVCSGGRWSLFCVEIKCCIEITKIEEIRVRLRNW